MPGSLLCRIVNGLTSCRAYFLCLSETHEEWVEWTCENFIGTRVRATALENAVAYVRWTIAEFGALRANLAKFAVLLAYLLHPWETHEEWSE